VNKWPVRHGASLGMGVMIVLGIATVALFSGSAAGSLPTGHVAEGMYVYEGVCASCHGVYADGTLDGPPLVGDGFPATTMSRDELSDAIEDRSVPMHQYDLPRQDVADTIAYLRQIQAYGGA
jgi:mono/diheme cytochrome c family protein